MANTYVTAYLPGPSVMVITDDPTYTLYVHCPDLTVANRIRDLLNADEA
jgi:hypothetical protein